MKRAASGAAPAGGAWVGGLIRAVAAGLSAGAALVSILNYTGTRGEARRGAGAALSPSDRAHRLTLAPATDTARSLGDTIQLAAVVTDLRGAALLGVTPRWSSADPGIVEVDQAGTAVARAAGMTVVMARVGRLESRARIAVVPRPAAIRAADTLLWVREGERVRPGMEVADARGFPVAGVAVHWAVGDFAVAAVDSSGEVSGVSPGRTRLTAMAGELRAELWVEVVPVPASITVLDGEDQRAPAGRPLGRPVTAQVVSRTGRPVAGAVVAFRPRSLPPEAALVDTADERGIVSTVWTLDALPGRQQLVIAVEGVEVAPVVSAEADPVPANTRVAVVEELPPGTAGDSLAAPAAIRVTDSTGLVLADLPVSWRTPDGGQLTALGARTDSIGEARALWRLGPRAGRQRLLAQVGNPRTMPPLTVSTTALAGAADSVVLRSGGAQRGVVGRRLARPIVVRALDRWGNPVAGARIHTLSEDRTSDTLTTDSLGQARVVWKLGGKAGEQRLRVALEGSSRRVEVTARAAAGPPSRLAFAAVPASAPAGRALGEPLTLELTDAQGNPVPGRRIAVAATRGTVEPKRPVTDSAGRARVRWTPAGTPGPVVLSASAERSEVRAKRTVEVVARRPVRVTTRRAP